MNELLDRRGLTETEAIARYRSRNYPRPAVTADIVIFRKDPAGTRLLLVKRGGHPFLGRWALPGGFASEQEPLEETAARELFEETGIRGPALHLVDLFSQPDRDPRGWVISAAYWALVDQEPTVTAGDDAAEARWFRLVPGEHGPRLCLEDLTLEPSDLAFDHNIILLKAMAAAGISPEGTA